MAIPPLLDTGFLAQGRHTCTVEEFHDSFVADQRFENSTVRPTIWASWVEAQSVLHSLVPTYAAWVGGSFVSAKVDPDDMDSVFIVDDHALQKIEDGELKHLVMMFARGGEFHKPAGRALDTFLLPWTAILASGALTPVSQENYYNLRGYWDDFWQRIRSGSKLSPPTFLDAVPRRGFLEVKLNEYPLELAS